MEVHEHRCIYCGYGWQCSQPECKQPRSHICAICEALHRLQSELPCIRGFSSR